MLRIKAEKNMPARTIVKRIKCIISQVSVRSAETNFKRYNDLPMKYYISKSLSTSFDKAVDMVTESLKKEGFGVLTEINIQDKMKEKLGVDFRKYLILGACNPQYAYKALQQEDKIGTMLPCSVILQELGDQQIEVAAIDPIASMMAVENPNLSDIATEIKQKLERVINSL